MPFIFRSDAGIMLIFHLQSGIWEFHFPFTCNLYGKCFGISVTHLTSDLEVPGSSPGVSNNFFSSFFFLFWLFNDHKIENRPPNSSPWRIKFLVRWSVINRPPIDFVRIFFLYLLLLLFSFFIYFYLFLHFFVYLKISQYPISLNFDTVIGHCHETWQEHFQGHQIIVTSSRRHFVKSRYPSYLHDASAKVIHIHITYTSGQGSTGHVIKGHIKVMTRAYVRVKI